MTIAMTSALAVTAVLAIAVAGLGTVYAARAQAVAAADAAALAAAVATYPPARADSPYESARQIAAQNGAVIIECRCPRDGGLAVRTVQVATAVTVVVPVFGEVVVRASSRAEFDPLRWLGR
jgi:hypothetical protein